jgi:hypothetical protein
VFLLQAFELNLQILSFVIVRRDQVRPPLLTATGRCRLPGSMRRASV